MFRMAVLILRSLFFINALMLAAIQELIYPAGTQFSLDAQRDGKNRAVLANLANKQALPSTEFAKLALSSLKNFDIFPATFQRLVKELSIPKKLFSQMHP